MGNRICSKECKIKHRIKCGCIALIHICKEIGFSIEETQEKLSKRLNISDTEAKAYLNRYWL